MRRVSCGRRAVSIAALVVFLAALAPAPAPACSMCRCSDPVFSALGEGLYTYGGFQIAVDWNRLDQTQGAEGHEGKEHLRGFGKHGGDFEEQVRNTVTATISYGWHERLTLVAQVPYAHNELTEADEVQKANGLGDPLFFVYGRIWASKFEQGLGRRAWLWAVFSVKTPWGENDVTADGVRLDEHVQPGTGSTDLFGGLSGLYLFDEKSAIFSSVSYRGTGTNDFGYKYGNILLANVAYERKFGERLDTVLELNYRWAGEDIVNPAGVRDPNTGGSVLYVTPRVIVGIAGGSYSWGFFTNPYEAKLTNTYWGTIEELHEVAAMYRAGQIRPLIELEGLPE